MCTWFSASWCFRYNGKCLFSCICNPRITISPTSLFSANFNWNRVKNHPKPWTCPLMVVYFCTHLIGVCLWRECVHVCARVRSIVHANNLITVPDMSALLYSVANTRDWLRITATIITALLCVALPRSVTPVSYTHLTLPTRRWV